MTRVGGGPRSAFGVGLVILGLAINPWTVGFLATADGAISQHDAFALVLLVSGICVLGGLQLLFWWVERVSFGRPVSVVRSVAVVGLVAAAVAATQWRVASYQSGHNHTAVVGSEHEHPTAEQQQWADDFHKRSLAAALKHGWFDIENALAQGFEVDRINANHFPNQQYMFDDVILDPERPEWLVYDQTPNGRVLMALMFFTRSLEEAGPTLGGPLAQWHYHPYDDVRCAIKGLWTVSKADANGQCVEGIPVTRTPEMFHVWFIDHPLGRFTEMKIVPEYHQDLEFDFSRLHPISVHFAIALFLIAVLLDLVAVAARKPQLHFVAWVNLAFAAFAALAAVAAGMTAEVLLKPTHDAHQTLDLHKLFGFGSLGVVLVLSAWRYALRGSFPRKAAALLYVVVSLVGVGVVGAAGYYGGEMVYRHGAGVRAIDQFARERYWKLVNEVYRKSPVSPVDHTDHH
jgi:uncharacterized membrane protein